MGRHGKRFWASKLPKDCYCCGDTSKPKDLHHRTYKNLGNERLWDLVPLCRPCHDRVHEIHRATRHLGLWQATNQLRRKIHPVYGRASRDKKKALRAVWQAGPKGTAELHLLAERFGFPLLDVYIMLHQKPPRALLNNGWPARTYASRLPAVPRGPQRPAERSRRVGVRSGQRWRSALGYRTRPPGGILAAQLARMTQPSADSPRGLRDLGLSRQ
jgi:hypothetical protein